MLSRFVRFCLVILLLATNGFTQVAGEAASNPSCSCGLLSLFRKSGWVVPGIEGARATTARSHYSVGKIMQPIFVTRMKGGAKVGRLVRLHCSDDTSGTMSVDDIDVEATDIYAFDVGGQVFAYGVVAGWVGEPDNTGRRPQIGTVSDVIFYDTTGTGKFSLMKYTHFPFLPEVPEWIRSKGK